MNINRAMWAIVSLAVLTTISVSIGISNRGSRIMSAASATPTPPAPPSLDLSKYSIVDYDGAPNALTSAEVDQRKIRNKRYDVSLTVMSNPPFDAERLVGYDVEPEPPPIPFAASRLIVVGSIQDAKAFLSNEKKGIYTEYTVSIEKVLKYDGEKKLKPGDLVVVDRAGGVVRYVTGQKILYMIAGQDLPEVNGRYLLFLKNDDPENMNYKILTGYQFKDGKVAALDGMNGHREFNGRSEPEFIKLVSQKKKEVGSKP